MSKISLWLVIESCKNVKVNGNVIRKVKCMTKAENIVVNPLGKEKINKLLVKFAIPSVIAMVVNAIYNMIDQICIGRKIGTNGNTATTVAFPITTVGLALALTLGQGGASKQNLELGANNKKKAESAVGNMIIASTFISVLLCILAQIFLKPLLTSFGGTAEVMPYAMEYSRIVVLGLPAAVVGTCLNNSIRADASPLYSMLSMAIGAVINIVLDIIFVFPLNMGMKGAALATILGQIATCLISFAYIRKFKNIKLTKESFKIDLKMIKIIFALGVASGINQIAMFIVQIALNNSMKYYGSRSAYGPNIPIACIGIVMKVNMLFMAIIIGISQGTQPIVSFNYGAKEYKRCRKTYSLASKVVLIISVVFFAIFQLCPDMIISIFGQGSKEYYDFSRKCFRIFLFMTVVNGLQPLTTVFFTSIGKAIKGAFIALTRQILFLLPLVVILPKFFGIDGIMYAGPIADFGSFILVVVFMIHEFMIMRKLEKV